jgi:hypothetical protein
LQLEKDMLELKCNQLELQQSKSIEIINNLRCEKVNLVESFGKFRPYYYRYYQCHYYEQTNILYQIFRELEIIINELFVVNKTTQYKIMHKKGKRRQPKNKDKPELNTDDI